MATGLSRRDMFVRTAASALTLSLAAALHGRASRARAEVDLPPDPEVDNEQLNALLAAEYDAIATYGAGAALIDADTASPEALRDTAKAVAVHFQSQHGEHAAALAALISESGGTPVGAPAAPDLPASFPASGVTTVDVLKLAADKEKRAAVAYVSVLSEISTQAAAKLVAAVGGVETQHFVLLYLLVEGLAVTTDATGPMAELVVPAAFITDVGPTGSKNLEDFPALDALLALDAG
jgi:Ferritin-like domain